MKYSIDTSALLDAWVRYYPPDVFASIWEKLSQVATNGTLIATEEVLFELEKKDDDVFKWAKSHSGMFLPVNEPIQLEVTSILGAHPRLVDTRRERSGADPFVIALAKIESCTVVTSERATGNLGKPNIPDVCSQMNIRCLHLLDMYRELGWRV